MKKPGLSRYRILITAAIASFIAALVFLSQMASEQAAQRPPEYASDDCPGQPRRSTDGTVQSSSCDEEEK